MSFEVLRSPVQFRQQVGFPANQDWLREYEEGISDAVDRAGTVVQVVRQKLGADHLQTVTL